MSGRRRRPTVSSMARFVLSHRHEASACRTAYAAWNGFDSPLRRGNAVASCASGGHRMFWTVEAASAEEALALLPPYVAERCEANAVTDVPIP
jgi:hypothetical protein